MPLLLPTTLRPLKATLKDILKVILKATRKVILKVKDTLKVRDTLSSIRLPLCLLRPLAIPCRV